MCIRDRPCPVCGYNLRQLTGNVCPECGQPFKLQVGAVHVRFGLFLLFLAPMLMVGGLGLLFAVISIAESPPPGTAWGFWAIMLAGLAEGPTVILLYRRRVVFQKRSILEQYVIAFLAWSAHIVFLIACFTFGTS